MTAHGLHVVHTLRDLSASRCPSNLEWEEGDGVSGYQVWADTSQIGSRTPYTRAHVVEVHPRGR